ncbi:MAG: hypothetical protein IPG58_09550 [Acidobacteria bacterium]|nr:hypothetical protein [Acidobacteriota bacterium]
MKKLYASVFGNIEHESDRGAVLIAQEIISNELAAMFHSLAPTSMSAKRVKELLKYPGLLATFSARSEMAYLAGFIGQNIFDAINVIRSIRNDAAHASQSFSLEPYRPKLVEAYRELGDLGGTSMEDFLRYMAIKLYLEPFADLIVEDFANHEYEGLRSAFKDRDEVIDHIREHHDSLEVAKSKLAKVELGMAVILLCGLIIYSRDRILAKRLASTNCNESPS